MKQRKAIANKKGPYDVTRFSDLPERDIRIWQRIESWRHEHGYLNGGLRPLCFGILRAKPAIINDELCLVATSWTPDRELIRKAVGMGQWRRIASFKESR